MSTESKPITVLAPTVPSPTFPATQQLIHDKVVAWLRDEARQQVDHVDPDASLFAMGVDSLGAASIAAEIERASGKLLDPQEMFDLETIHQLAVYVDALPAAPAGARSRLGGQASGAPASQPAGETSASRAAAERAGPPPQAVPNAGTSPLAATAGSTAAHAPVGDARGAKSLEYFAQRNRKVKALKQAGLYFFEPEISQHDGSWVVANGQRMLMLGSYEYLGLLGHPHLMKSAINAIEEFGTGHHGVRLLAGTTTIHRQLEAKLARLMQAEESIVFSSGYVTNLAAVSTLVGRGDVVIGDQWNHASIMDGCRMSGAEFLEFKHNDMNALAERLNQAAGRRTLVVVDAVFSMDGDIIDLPRVVELCRQHGALLMVDEAHSMGVLGETGRGVQEHFNLPPDAIDVKMGTLSKTFAGCGGFVAGKEEIITYLRHHARGYIFSGALPAGQAAVALAAVEVLESEPQLVAQLRTNTEYYLSSLKALGFDTAKSVTPIVPVMTRTDQITLEMTRLCREAGLLVIPVCFPAVPIDAPRLRTCVSAIHSRRDLDFAIEILARYGRETGLIA